MEYENFIASKLVQEIDSGFDPVEKINRKLFDFQKDIVIWALRKGKAAIFADCGLGKTPMQLEWARQVCLYTKGSVLILAPLAVSDQTVREGIKFKIKVNICREQDDIKEGINITNYENFHNFDANYFDGIVLDESSILKAYSGKIRTEIIKAFSGTSYKLACTATPAPNDHMELGNHSEFLNAMTRVQMLSMFFVHDGGETSKWRLKGHAESEYWKWVCSWAIYLRKPSDLGYDDSDFKLPKLVINDCVVKSKGKAPKGQFFKVAAKTISERRIARKESLNERVGKVVELVNSDKENPWLIWCDLNIESQELRKRIKDSIEITGSDKNDYKKKEMINFSNEKTRILITKPSIAGYGMNWQHCGNMIFVGLSDSWEKYYQAVRRCWRFGRIGKVNVWIVTSDLEGAVVNNIKRKEADAEIMAKGMVNHMSKITKREIKKIRKEKKKEYNEYKESGKRWEMYLGDCVDVSSGLKDDSIHYSIFSPPFAELYTYSDSERDMGNSKNYDEFFIHFGYLVENLFRITKPGRLLSFHCMDIPSMKERDGVIGLKDFPGDLLRLFQKYGWIYHSRHIIWKDPLIEVTRTKALGLMHKQIQKDSSMSRAGCPDYLITVRKPGKNQELISNPNGFTDFIGEESKEPKASGIKYSHHVWQKYASPVWMDIRQSNTLQYRSARDQKDEKHICPLQLDVIERAIRLWSNEGDLVYSPFTGIGSEGYVALQMGRLFIGSELKESYFKQAIKNLKNARNRQSNLFDNASTKDKRVRRNKK